MPQGNHTTHKGGPVLPAACLKSTRPTTNTGLIHEQPGPVRRHAAVSQPFKSAHIENIEVEDLIATELVQCTGLRLNPGKTTLLPISHPQPGLGRILTPDTNTSIHDEAAMIQCSSVWHQIHAHIPAPCAIHLISRFLPQIYPVSKLNK